MKRTVEAILISKGQMDRIYKGSVPLNLWRSLHRSVKSDNPLYPDFEPREVRPGFFRDPDITLVTIGGVVNVLAEVDMGTSLFDRSNIFGASSWIYFEIPAGTVIPEGLLITKDKFNDKMQATHYTILPNFTMPKAQFCALLDQLARNAAARRAALRHG